MALTERLQDTTHVGYWRGEIPLQYVYTCGRAGEAFFRRIKDKGTFSGARCDKCDILYVPPRVYCERCFARLEKNLEEVSPVGTVHTFTVMVRNLDGSRKKTPTIMAVIRLEGTDGGLVHYLEGVKPEEVQIGMRVTAVLKTKKHRQGHIHDILHFKPLP